MMMKKLKSPKNKFRIEFPQDSVKPHNQELYKTHTDSYMFQHRKLCKFRLKNPENFNVTAFFHTYLLRNVIQIECNAQISHVHENFSKWFSTQFQHTLKISTCIDIFNTVFQYVFNIVVNIVHNGS